jgi:hypothetical protein
MSVTVGLTKAQIKNLDPPHQEFQCQFNPNELAITKKNSWTAKKAAGAHIPAVHFDGVGALSLQLTLIFDTLESGQDVSNVTNGLLALMEATASDPEPVQKKKQARPPHVQFIWGKWHSPTSVITDFSQTFTLFHKNGTPLRATVKLTLQEVPATAPKEVAKGQNPTSRAAGTRRAHLVQPGETLDLIAAQELGDPTTWRRVAEFNQVDDPRRLQPGALLAIPPDDFAVDRHAERERAWP